MIHYRVAPMGLEPKSPRLSLSLPSLEQHHSRSVLPRLLKRRGLQRALRELNSHGMQAYQTQSRQQLAAVAVR